MARRRNAADSQPDRSHNPRKKWNSLTWNDLDAWAGNRSVSRGEAYQRQGRVKDLSLADDGRLLATVVGSQPYVTSAWLATKGRRHQQVESVCTCPVGVSGCKHAVAVLVDFLSMLADEREVPLAKPDDPRWSLFSDNDELYDECSDEVVDFDDNRGLVSSNVKFNKLDDLNDPSGMIADKRSEATKGRRFKRRTRAQWDQALQSHIQQKSQTELATLVWSLCERFPELREEFQERIALSEGDVDRLLSAARRELRSVTSEIGWQNHWNNEGHTPEYGRLKHRMERLVELGHCDEVFDLGRELITRGLEQVGHSHDEGETAMELAACLNVVFDALSKSTLSAADKILYAIDACLEDDYDIVGSAADKILAAQWTPTDWSQVADQLAQRLRQAPHKKSQDNFSQSYARDRISGFLAHALKAPDAEMRCCNSTKPKPAPRVVISGWSHT